MSLPQNTWLNQFGASYAVPTELTQHPRFADVSCGNDMCPRFQVLGAGDAVDLWADHPDPKLREVAGARFIVILNNQTTKYEGEDVNEAIRVALHVADNIPCSPKPGTWHYVAGNASGFVYDANNNIVAEIPKHGAGFVPAGQVAPWHNADKHGAKIAMLPELFAVLIQAKDTLQYIADRGESAGVTQKHLGDVARNRLQFIREVITNAGGEL